MKTGRNAPCPCGSGRKYKHCHGSISSGRSRPPPPEMERALRMHEAAEAIREQQQGYGNPIVSFLTPEGFRMIAVKSTVYYSKEWHVFPDFLLHFMKEVMGRAWGDKNAKSRSTHPLFRWLAKLQELKREHHAADRVLQSAPMTGYAAAVIHLSYSLYLLAHHDQIPNLLLTRLRSVEKFLPAYYEALVGAVFAVAGFSIELLETRRSGGASPEFRVRSKRSGRSYAVEAKFRSAWSSLTTNVENPAFQDELAKYVRRRLRDATDQLRRAFNSEDELSVVCIELNLPALTTEGDWRKVSSFVDSVIADASAKNATSGTTEAFSAYVLLTNHTFLANEDGDGEAMFAALLGYGIPDLVAGRPVELEQALAGYDRHRDLYWLIDCTRIARRIPVTFDGTPTELLDKNGSPIKPISIGDRINYPDHPGQPQTGIVEEISALKTEATAIVADESTGRRVVIRIPLTEAESRAVSRHGDRVFGKPEGVRKLKDGDLFGLYDFFLDSYRGSSREGLLRAVKDHPQLHDFEQMDLEALRTRVCRELTRSMYAQAQERRQ